MTSDIKQPFIGTLNLNRVPGLNAPCLLLAATVPNSPPGGRPYWLFRAALAAVGSLALGTAAAAPIKVVATIPELAYAAQEIGGNLVEARALLDGSENPHAAEATPEFVRLAADADVVCAAGLGLEAGFLPAVLAKSGNAEVQAGGKGFCEAGPAVTVLEKPSGPVDRSMGDVHPSGNPHFWLHPNRLAEAAAAIAAALSKADPGHRAAYQDGLKKFQGRMALLQDAVAAKLKPLRDLQTQAGGAVVIEYHKEFLYFLDGYGLKSFGSIEEKPGVPPSAGRLAKIAQEAAGAGVKAGLAADYSPASAIGKFTELSGIPVNAVPTMIQSSGRIKTYEELQKHIAARLLESAVMRGKR